MATLKTTETDASVSEFLHTVEDPKRRADCEVILALMQSVTKAAPKMWGPSIVGFGTYHYTYASGREGDWFLMGFSPRKTNLTLYLCTGFQVSEADLAALGKVKTGKSCLYIKSLDDIHLPTLKKLLTASIAFVTKKKA